MLFRTLACLPLLTGAAATLRRPSIFWHFPGYLDRPRLSPIGEHALAEQRVITDVHARARFGSYAALEEQDERVRTAVAWALMSASLNLVF